MLALRLDENRLRVAEVNSPAPVSNEAIVRVTLSGICNTDVEIARGYAGFSGTLGHEFVGVVETAPDAPELVGRRVVGEINAGCGSCEKCRAGDARHCATRTVLGIVGRDGAHAEYLTLPTVNLLPVPDGISDEEAVFAEPLAAAYGILEQVKMGNETAVAVIGDGKLGLLCAQALALTGAKLTLVGKHDEKLIIAARRGIETINLAESERRAGEYAVVIEASGSAGGFNLALDLLRPRGTLVLKSTFHGAAQWDAARIVVNEITVVGSRCGRFAPALDLLAQKVVDVKNMISARYALADGVRAMQHAQVPGVLKILLHPSCV